MHTLTDLDQRHVFVEDRHITVIDCKFLYEIGIPGTSRYQCVVLLLTAKRNYQGRNSRTPLVKAYFLVFE